jgi:hypothetical protein
MAKSSFLTQGNYPYMIHACPLSDKDFPYPTHTHGLYDLGLPEFIIDPLAFGGEGNGLRINSAFRYFMNPLNAGQLDAVLSGQIIKLTGPQLDPKYMLKDPYTYCFRKIYADFEAVKQAYGKGVVSLVPAMEFIQIWVDGDDYALTDEYYLGGVTW